MRPWLYGFLGGTVVAAALVGAFLAGRAVNGDEPAATTERTAPEILRAVRDLRRDWCNETIDTTVTRVVPVLYGPQLRSDGDWEVACWFTNLDNVGIRPWECIIIDADRLELAAVRTTHWDGGAAPAFPCRY